jgi:type II secretory pathway pseudopilin PulG
VVRSAVAAARSRTVRAEGGITLVELMITISLLSVVLVMFFTVLASVQGSLVRQSSRSTSNDQARLAVQELDREIRSGNVLYDPSLESDAAHFIFPGMSLRVYTQSNATTREGGGLSGERCVQWRIKYRKYGSDGVTLLAVKDRRYELQRRQWAQQAGTPVAGSDTNWQAVADRVMNRSVSPQKAAFTVDPAKRTVSISILTNSDSSAGGNVQVDTTVEGRNTIYGYPNSVCATVPAYPQPDPAE